MKKQNKSAKKGRTRLDEMLGASSIRPRRTQQYVEEGRAEATTQLAKRVRPHIHFIGICGVTMAPLAVLYKKMGWRVTGSDRAFFPPMSTYLKRNGIVIMPGFKEEHLNEKPDLIVVMAFVTKKNPELALAIRRHIPYKTYGEVLPDLIEKRNSVVVAGSRGKTSVAALVTWVLETAGYKPSFMIGGMPKNFFDGIRRTDSDWSVIEGDEYPLAQWKKQSRFLSYHPRYLVLTSATWDHIDIFPTEKSYLASFEKLVKKVPRDGIIIANADDKNLKKILKNVKASVHWYSQKDMGSWRAPYEGKAWRENSAAAKLFAQIAGVSDNTTQKSFRSFKGIARRQEVRYESKSVVVIDDNAHTPEKVEGTLGTIHARYPKRKIIALYEPGNRSEAALKQKGYKTCFAGAYAIILPRVSSAQENAREWNEKLARKLSSVYTRIVYIPDDQKLLQEIKSIVRARKGSGEWAVVFMSQKGFRGMIDEFVKKLESKR